MNAENNKINYYINSHDISTTRIILYCKLPCTGCFKEYLSIILIILISNSQEIRRRQQPPPPPHTHTHLHVVTTRQWKLNN